METGLRGLGYRTVEYQVRELRIRVGYYYSLHNQTLLLFGPESFAVVRTRAFVL
jgi:hypothetical protein